MSVRSSFRSSRLRAAKENGTNVLGASVFMSAALFVALDRERLWKTVKMCYRSVRFKYFFIPVEHDLDPVLPYPKHLFQADRIEPHITQVDDGSLSSRDGSNWYWSNLTNHLVPSSNTRVFTKPVWFLKPKRKNSNNRFSCFM
jgi:hypothetical protein